MNRSTSAGLDDTVEAFNRNYSANTIFLTQPLLSAAENMWNTSITRSPGALHLTGVVEDDPEQARTPWRGRCG